MQAFLIQDTKAFMGQLFYGALFEDFLLEEAGIVSACTFLIDGHTNEAYFAQGSDAAQAPAPSLRPFPELRPTLAKLIQGKRPPLSMAITLHMAPAAQESLLQKQAAKTESSALAALVLNIKYDGEKVTLISAPSYRRFVPDKSLDALWDGSVAAYLEAKKIAFELP